MTTFIRGETVVIKGTIKDEDGILVSPSNSPVVTVLDPEGGAVVDAQQATLDTVGLFRHMYNPATLAVLGPHHVRVITTQEIPASDGLAVFNRSPYNTFQYNEGGSAVEDKLSIADSEFFLVD